MFKNPFAKETAPAPTESTFSTDSSYDVQPPTKQNSSRPSLSYRNKKILRRVLFGTMFLVLAFVIVRAISVKPQNVKSQELGSSSRDAIASAKIGQSYPFNARNGSAQLVDKKQVKMTIAEAEINKKIIIKGSPATARDGKAFLILTVEIENSNTDKLYLPVNDLVRMQDGDKMKAPDVHNNLVLAEPIATKTTRIGFLIDDTAREFALKIGEVTGAKQTIDLKF